MHRAVVPFVALSLALVARAEDTDPPLISHTPVEDALQSESVPFSAQMEDESEIFAPTLYFRFPGQRGYSSVAMKREGDAFVAHVGASAELEYWIEAYDELGNGPSRDGTPDRPHRVPIVTLAEREKRHPTRVAEIQIPVVPPEIVEPDCALFPEACVKPEPPIYKRGWFLGTAGVVVAGVATAIAFGLTPDPIYRNSFSASAGR